MDSSNIFWRYCTPNAYVSYAPPCGCDPYYDDSRDIDLNRDSTPINLVQCERCGTYFAPSSEMPPWVQQMQRCLCDKCRAEADSQ